VKTLIDNVYYYQDELGSTSHIASMSGALIESYQYDVYGKPRVYDSGGVYHAGATPVANFLQGGARWMPELGLYDDRNRFMSPDLGRFIQPDPIGFKGDASNLYRYCGNDWANRTDPMGLEAAAQGLQGPDLVTKEQSNMIHDDRSFQEKLSAWLTHMERGAPNAFSVEAGKAIAENVAAGKTWAQNGPINISRAPADKNGVVSIEKPLFDKSVAAAKADHEATMTDGMERHTSVFVDSNRQFVVSPPNIGKGKPWTGPQYGFGPNPGQGQALASSVHSHSNDRLMGGEDFYKGNANHVPIFVGLKDGRVQVYYPKVNARPTENAQGTVFFVGP
jgi:RHS repeat-associated protein